VVFETAIPELLAPLAALPEPVPHESEASLDETAWDGATAPADLPGEIVLEPAELEGWMEGTPPVPAPDGEMDFDGQWSAVRDANIRPYVDWVVAPPVSLPVVVAKPPQQQHQHQHHHPGGPRPGGGGGGQQGGNRDRDKRGRRRKRRQGRDRGREPANRGPRLPGVYNPGGD
jgi:hypothetical protein